MSLKMKVQENFTANESLRALQDKEWEDRKPRTEKDEHFLHAPSSRRMKMMRAEEKLCHIPGNLGCISGSP